MMSSVVCLMLLSMVSAYNLTCPHLSQWETRATAECNDIDSYVCLWDEVDDIYKEKCTGPKKAREGFKSVFNLGNYNKQPCWPSNFQPFIFTTIGNKECIYQKSLCNEEGQVYGDTGSQTGDRGCRCDYTRGYAFVMRNTDPCYCIPFKEDCSCYFKKCDEGNMLSPDYFCSKDINLQQNYTCPTVFQNTEDVEQDVEQEHVYVKNGHEYTYRFVWVGFFVSATVIMLTVLIVVLIFLWKKLDAFLDKYRKGYVVAAPPTVLIKDKDESVVIDYELSKSGIVVNWFKDKDKIDVGKNDNYQTEIKDNHYKLTINHVSEGNAGGYFIEVEGKRSPITELQVRGYVITAPSTVVERNKDESVVIDYELSKSGLLIKWFKDGEKIDVEKNDHYQTDIVDKHYKLTIKNISKEHAGEYYVEVEGKLSPVSELKVRGYIITDTPTTMIKNEGERATIVYELSKSGIQVAWFKDDIMINPNINDNFKIENTGNVYSLTVLYISKEYAGKYQLAFLNGRKVIRSSIFELQVTDKCKEIVKEEGQSVIIQHEFSKSGLPMYLLKDGTHILSATDSNFHMESSEYTYQLTIKYLSCKNSGSYKLKVGNMYSSTSIIQVKPIFKSELESITCTEGEDAILQCEVMEESMKVTWLKEGEVITNELLMEETGTIRKLKIVNTKQTDGGTYRIKAHEAKREAVITVKPYICIPLEDTVIMECLEAKLVCKAEEVHVKPKWYKDGEILGMTNNILLEESESGEYSLTIKESSIDHKGSYSVDLNGHKSKATLDVKALPESIKRMSEKDRSNFITAAKEGTAPRYYIRVMIVGKSGVGKTCLLRRLMGNDIGDVPSTDGINIEIKRCQIDIKTGDWCFSKDPERYEISLSSNTANKADCGFWDFAGQKDYYATHQTFLTEHAIYLVVVRLKNIYDNKKDKKESHDFENIEGTYPSRKFRIETYFVNL